MEQETSAEEGDSYDSPQRASIRFVLCVLLGLYLAGYLAFRLKCEPYQPISYNDTFVEHGQSFRWLWKSDQKVQYKIFATIYWPCMAGEDWLIRKVLM